MPESDRAVYVPIQTDRIVRTLLMNLDYHLSRDCPKWPGTMYYEWPESKARDANRRLCQACRERAEAHNRTPER